MKQGKRFLSVLLTLALLAALISAAVVPAAAISLVGPIMYIDETGTTPAMKTCIIISSNDTKDEDFTWNDDNVYKAYAVTQNVTYDRRVKVEGDVVLILCDGATLTVDGGLRVPEGSSLTVFAQSKGTGKLIADAPATNSTINAAGIGGGYQGKGGTVNIYGGTVEAVGDSRAAGIGGGYGGDGGTVNIYGGTVTATGGDNGAGIGGGYQGEGGTVNIYGGTVTATGGDGSAGIGGGRRDTSKGLGGEGGTVNIYGGEVTAIGGGEGAGIGGGLEGEGAEVSIYGGKVTAYSLRNGAGIGGGFDAGGKKLTVYGGTVEATGSGRSAAIGAGSGDIWDKDGGTILLYGGTITAQSGEYGIGIGGGYQGGGTTVEIRDAAVTAEGGGGAFRCYYLTLSGELDVFAPKDAEAPVEEDREGALRQSSVMLLPYASYLDTDGSVKKQYEYTPVTSSTKTLSGGWYAVSGEVTVNERIDVTGDAKLILRDGTHLNAAQGVHLPAGSKISLTVYGQREGTGALTARAPKDCAGIGGNKDENGGTLTVNGGVITATGGDYGAGVGGGDTGAGGTVTVNGGSLTAYGKNGSAGIGGGDYGDGGTLEVKGGVVAATGSAREPNSSSGEAAAAGIGAGRPKLNGSDPRSSGTFKMSGGSVTATPGTPGEGYEGAQAIGVNEDDALKLGNIGQDRICLSDGLKVSVNGTPWGAAIRADGCRESTTVQIEACDHHRFVGGKCHLCGVAEYPCYVTFHANDTGANPATATQTVKYDTATALRANSFAAPTGQELAGWNTQADGKGKNYRDGEQVALTEDLELYAQWRTQVFEIVWKDEDGSVIDVTSVEYGTVPTHADAEKKPTPDFIYTFKGWTPEIVEATSDAAYTAMFHQEQRGYTITWMDGGGNVIDTTTVAYGTVPKHADATKKATAQYTYTFKGWAPEIEAATGDAVYTAQFQETLRAYAVTFHANDGTDATATQQGMLYGTPTALTKNTFAREWFVFTGWNTQADGKGTPYADGAEVGVKGDLALYAQWRRVTVIESVKATEQGGYVARVSCAPGVSATVWAARYDALGRFLGAERKTLTPGEETEFTVVRGAAATVRFFVLDDAGAPLCEAVDGPR